MKQSTIAYITGTLLLVCCIDLQAQITPKGINNVMRDQKIWQMNQLPANSVQRRMNSSAYSQITLDLRKQKLPEVKMPAFMQNQVNDDYSVMITQVIISPHNDWRNRSSYRLSNLPKRFLPVEPVSQHLEQ